MKTRITYYRPETEIEQMETAMPLAVSGEPPQDSDAGAKRRDFFDGSHDGMSQSRDIWKE